MSLAFTGSRAFWGMELTGSSGGNAGKVSEFLWWKSPFMVSHGRREVKGAQPGWEGTSASFTVGKT